jgi:hypothetical protein
MGHQMIAMGQVLENPGWTGGPTYLDGSGLRVSK